MLIHLQPPDLRRHLCLPQLVTHFLVCLHLHGPIHQIPTACHHLLQGLHLVIHMQCPHQHHAPWIHMPLSQQLLEHLCHQTLSRAAPRQIHFLNLLHLVTSRPLLRQDLILMTVMDSLPHLREAYPVIQQGSSNSSNSSTCGNCCRDRGPSSGVRAVWFTQVGSLSQSHPPMGVMQSSDSHFRLWFRAQECA